MLRHSISWMLLFCCGFLQSSADVKLARIFSDHMVLQRNKPIRFWGWADPGEKFTIDFAGKHMNVKAGKNGEWEAEFAAMGAGGPYELDIPGEFPIHLFDILIGEVWICSGQSNMEWGLLDTRNAKEEMARANLPLIRHFKVAHRPSFEPVKDLEQGEWEVCSPATAGNFTAVGYYFARTLFHEINVPIGLINSSWGGTNVETWISAASFFGDPEFASLRGSMPASPDSFIQRQKAKTENLISQVQGSLPPVSESFSFREQSYNDAAWSVMSLPNLWEDKGLTGLDGVVWFRKSFSIPASYNLSETTLYLGPIDDQDSTFINGIFVGSVKIYNEDRVYRIKPGILKTGDNVIAVKVKDTGGGGGIYGENDQLYISSGGQRIDLAGDWKFRIAEIEAPANSVSPNAFPTLLYNGMIHPLVRLGIAGSIWYQGESNAGRAVQYRTAFPLMIRDWRKIWKSEFPFLFVQLAAFDANGGNSQNGGSEWAELREAQTMALRLPHTGMAVTIDIGESKDIHPRNKLDVGKRLAAVALNGVYGLKREFSGPTLDTMVVRNSQTLLTFNHAKNGLVVKNKYGYINGFEVAGPDQKFYYARAWVLDSNRVVVESPSVISPVAVRYAWADDPNDVNLFNKEGFPAEPFRTDQWPEKTMGKKYAMGQ